MSSTPTSHIAVLVDYENVAKPEATGLAGILTQASREGTIVVRRAYANWVRFSSHKHHLRAAGFEMIDVVSVNGKNGVDIKLVVDAMELAFTKDYIDTFIIVSGDSDFIPLVVKLNELNRRAWLCVGNSQISPALAKFCFRMPSPAKSVPEVRAKTLPESRGKIGPTVPKTKPVPSLAKPAVSFSPAQLKTLHLAVHICELVVVPPLPLSWLFSMVRVLEPTFDRTSCVGNGKRPQVRMAERLQQIGLLEFNFDERLGNYVFSAGAEYRLLPFPPTSHASFDAAVAKLQSHVDGCQDERFNLRPGNSPGQLASDTACKKQIPGPSADIKLYCVDESHDVPGQLEFSFE